MGSAQSTPSAPPPTSAAPVPPPGCPMHQSNVDSASSVAPLNPLNNIPALAQAPSPGQKTTLPLERTVSSIPRASTTAPSACPAASTSASASASTPNAKEPEADAKTTAWEYPSPQQFYNALVRKGWETPEESIEMMVNIHNWLNEAAWQQVRTWEEKHTGFVSYHFIHWGVHELTLVFILDSSVVIVLR